VRLPRRLGALVALSLGVGAVVPAGATPGGTPGAVNLVDRSCRLVVGSDGRNAVSRSGEDAPPYGNTSCPGIRPGAEYVTAIGRCTFAWVYRGSDGATYLATAGHCALATNNTTTTWRGDTGPLVGDPQTGQEIGRFVWATRTDGATDFALVKLRRGLKADPQLCHFGGPLATTSAVNLDPVDLVHYGHGLGMENLRARTSKAVHGLRRADWVTAFGAATPGDSGGPAMTADGQVVGVIDELRGNGNGNVAITRVGPMLAAATKALGVRFTLRTAPLL
jgi:hypothetical protein